MLNVSSRVWPRAKACFSKCLSKRTGRATRPTSSVRNHSTASWPARGPVLATRTVARRRAAGPVSTESVRARPE